MGCNTVLTRTVLRGHYVEKLFGFGNFCVRNAKPVTYLVQYDFAQVKYVVGILCAENNFPGSDPICQCLPIVSKIDFNFGAGECAGNSLFAAFGS